MFPRWAALSLAMLLWATACVVTTDSRPPATDEPTGLIVARLDGQPWLVQSPLDSIVVGYDPQLDFFQIHAWRGLEARLWITVCATPARRAYGFLGPDSASAWWRDRTIRERSRPDPGFGLHTALGREGDSVVITHLD